MHEYVFTAFPFDEAISFCIIEPLYCTLFHTGSSPRCIEHHTATLSLNEKGVTHPLHLSCPANKHRSHIIELITGGATAKSNNDETKSVQ